MTFRSPDAGGVHCAGGGPKSSKAVSFCGRTGNRSGARPVGGTPHLAASSDGDVIATLVRLAVQLGGTPSTAIHHLRANNAA
jgi:hypothetical protein